MDRSFRRASAAFRLWIAATAVWLLTFAGSLARAESDTVDFVTQPGACATHIDDQGNGRDPQLQAGTTHIELWADYIENASSVSVTNANAEAGTVTATLGTKRNGATNASRGCPLKGSVEVTVVSAKTITSDLLRVLTIKRSDNANTFVQQIKVKAIPQFDMTFRGTEPLTCLVKTGSAQFLENNKRLQIQLPGGHLTDNTNCTLSLTLDLKIPQPVPIVQVTDDYSYALSSTLTQQTFVASGATGTIIQGGKPLRLTSKLTPAFTPVANPPSFFTPPAAQFMNAVGFLAVKAIQIPLNVASFRAVRTVQRLTITATATNGRASSVTVDILPAPAPSGISSAAASPTTVDVGNIVDITAILANAAPAGGEAITFRVTTAGCFVTAETSAPLPAVRGNPGVGVVNIPDGVGAVPGVTVLSLRANNTAAECVGVGAPPTTATHRVELFVGDFASDPNVLNIPVGPTHVIVPFTIRKVLP